MTVNIDEKLFETGFAPNAYILDLNGSLSVPQDMDLPAPWSLPSRLFRFPIEVLPETAVEPRRLGLMHPLLADHPFVQQVEGLLGFRLDPNGAPNAYGVTNQDNAQWWHAVDLVSAGHWRELIETAAFTTPLHIAGAVCYGLDYSPANAGRPSGHLSPSEARSLLQAIDAQEPSDCAAILHRFSPPISCKQDGGRESWPVNSGCELDAAARAWGRLFGIVEGWFIYNRSGFLQWSKYGRDRFEAGAKGFFVETTTGQGGFAF